MRLWHTDLIKYLPKHNYVGSAELIYHSEKDVVIVPSPTPVPTVTPIPTVTLSDSSSDPDSQPVSSPLPGDETGKDYRPLIIGVIAGGIVLVLGLYLVLVEIPYQKKKRAYYRKHGRR